MQRQVGRSNGGPGIVAVGRYLGTTYVVYGSAESVLVLNGNCELLQVLHHPNRLRQAGAGASVRTVDFCSARGKVRKRAAGSPFMPGPGRG